MNSPHIIRSHFFIHLATEERQYGYLRNAREHTADKYSCEAFKNRQSAEKSFLIDSPLIVTLTFMRWN